MRNGLLRPISRGTSRWVHWNDSTWSAALKNYKAPRDTVDEAAVRWVLDEERRVPVCSTPSQGERSIQQPYRQGNVQ